MTNIVALIPARGGSKGLPKKNVLPLAGKPLISYTLDVANASKYITRIVIATDDDEIASVAEKYGAEAPFRLPTELAADFATTEGSLKYAVDWLEQNENYKSDVVVFFQATDFFKRVAWVDETIETLLRNPEIDSAFIGCKTHKNYWRRENGSYIRTTPFTSYGARQKKEPIFREDTGLGCATRDYVIKNGKRLGDNVKLLEKEYDFFDIHNEFDFWLVEQMILNKKQPLL
jgi:CMP-N-acetylneuraminic acid synthetase